MIYILFISKYLLKEKIKLLIIFSIASTFLIFEMNSYASIINMFYSISTISYILFYFKENTIKRYRIVNLFTLLLIGLNIYTLIFKVNYIELELLINTLIRKL